MEVNKQVIGIDVSKDHLDCCYGLGQDGSLKVYAEKQFPNTRNGVLKLKSWINGREREVFKKIKKEGYGGVLKNVEKRIVCEGTGVYHELLAYSFYTWKMQNKTNVNISVELATQVKHYFKSLTTKSKTDKIDAQGLCRLGVERQLKNWKPISQTMRGIKELVRERHQIVEARTVLKNQLHAEKTKYFKNTAKLKRMNDQIAQKNKLTKDIEKELKAILKKDKELNAKVMRMLTINGIGFVIAMTIIAETDGFEKVRNAKELASFAGLDPVIRQSGKYQGKSKISKKGNKYLRTAMFQASLNASKNIPQFKRLKQRIVNKTGIKAKGNIAVARKLLLLAFSLWKSGEVYDQEKADGKIKKSKSNPENNGSKAKNHEDIGYLFDFNSKLVNAVNEQVKIKPDF